MEPRSRVSVLVFVCASLKLVTEGAALGRVEEHQQIEVQRQIAIDNKAIEKICAALPRNRLFAINHSFTHTCAHRMRVRNRHTKARRLRWECVVLR